MNATDKLKARRIPTEAQMELPTELENEVAAQENNLALADEDPGATTRKSTTRTFMFQFVSKQDGRRSEPFIGDWETLRKILYSREEGESPTDDDYILLVAILDGKDTQIPATPLITVRSFLDFEGPRNV